jgi:hypothetical protein
MPAIDRFLEAIAREQTDRFWPHVELGVFPFLCRPIPADRRKKWDIPNLIPPLPNGVRGTLDGG